jgi:hypothetical protein
VEALLQRPEAGPTVLVQTNHFAINDAGSRQAVLQRSNDVGKLEVLRRALAAEQGQLVTIEISENTQTVVLRLKDPGRVVKRCGYQRTEHGLDLAWHGCGLELLRQPRQCAAG